MEKKTNSPIDTLANSAIEDCVDNYIIFWQGQKKYHMYFTPQKEGIKIELSYMFTQATEVVGMDISNSEAMRKDTDFLYFVHLEGDLSTVAYKLTALSTIISFFYCAAYTDFAENIEKYVDIKVEEQN